MTLLATTTPALDIAVTEAPLPAQLLSLALLTEATPELRVDPWVLATAARLTADQRARNSAIFGLLSGALSDDLGAADLPAYVMRLAQADPAQLVARAAAGASVAPGAATVSVAPYSGDGAALRELLSAHLRELWETVLAAEWRKHELLLRNRTHALRGVLMQTDEEAGMQVREQWEALVSDEVATWVARARRKRLSARLRQHAPAWAAQHIARARRVRLSLSPHVAFAVTSGDGGETAHVFMQFDNSMMRMAPVRPAEVFSRIGALADETRLRLLELLAARGELRGQEIIAELGASQPVVSRNLKLLVGAGLVEERRAGDTNKWYRLQPDGTGATFVALAQLLDVDNARADIAEQRSTQQRDTALSAYPAALQPFINPHGRVHAFSGKRSEQQPVLDYLFGKIESGREYTEQQINELIGSWLITSRHGTDPVTIRRALVEERGLNRTKDGARYWRAE